jgi:hypothetical protein
MMPVLSLASFALFIGLVLAILSLVDTGAIYGWPLPVGMPMWVGILILMVLFQVVSTPIRVARHASRHAWGPHYGWFAMWDGLFMTGVTIIGVWLLFRHMPPVHDFPEFMHHLPEAVRGAGTELMTWIRSVFDKSR